MGDRRESDRLRRLLAAAEALRDGRFGIDVPSEEPGDDLDKLARILHGLSHALEKRWREVEEMDAVLRRINAGLLLDEVLDQFYEEAKGIFPYERIGLALLEEGDTVVRARWARSELGPLRLEGGYAARIEGSSLADVLESGRPRILNDLAAYLALKPSSESTRLVVEEGFRSSLACPLVAAGVPIGFLFFSSSRPGAYADAHVDAYLRIAGELSILVERSRLVSELVERKTELEVRNRFITSVFGRYLSDTVVERLLESPDGLRIGGERRVVTVLMTDLRGFTPMAERIPPEQVVSLLNVYLGTMSEVILRHGGTIDEFIGDAILALFGAPLGRPDDAARALACAVEMQQEMAGVNARARAMGLPETGMGIGIHTGEVVVGNFGSERRAKYGVVGSPINVASRIQGYTLGGQVLASDETIRAAGNATAVGARFLVHPKGVREPVPITEVLGAGPFRIAPVSDPLTPLGAPVEIELVRVEPAEPEHRGTTSFLRAIGRWEAAVETPVALEPRDEVRMRLPGNVEVRARVLGPTGRGAGVRVRFGSLPEQATHLLAVLSGRELASGGA